jgi:type III restriction enzyme
MVEIKAEGQINTDDVIKKKEAALNYCKYASEYTAQNGGKPWKYLLMPHNEVNTTNSFGFFINRF